MPLEKCVQTLLALRLALAEVFSPLLLRLIAATEGLYRHSQFGHCHYCCFRLGWCSASHGKGERAQSRCCCLHGVWSISPSGRTGPLGAPQAGAFHSCPACEQPWKLNCLGLMCIALGTLRYPTHLCSSLASACKAVIPPHACPVHMPAWLCKPLRALALQSLSCPGVVRGKSGNQGAPQKT